MNETEHLLSTQANTNRLKQSIKKLDMHNKPLKITLEFYDKKISTEVDHSDLKLDVTSLPFAKPNAKPNTTNPIDKINISTFIIICI